MFWIIIVLCLALDQLTKFIVDSSMALGETIAIIPGVLDLCYVRNQGAAFSILMGKQLFLICLTGMLMVFLAAYVIKNGSSVFPAEKYAIALIIGGGLGNLISRMLKGYVTDFFNIYILPVFNVADIFICAGCALLVLSVLYLEPKALKKDKANSDTNE